MKHFGIDTPMRSHHKFNEHGTLSPIIDQLQAGNTIALVSDAGTPAISDPGFLLSRACREHGIEVETLPGATRLEALTHETRTMIFYESPLRLVKTLQQLCEAFGPDRDASVSREISKVHNTTHNGTLHELCLYFNDNPPRGEIVLVVAGCPETKNKVDKYAQFKNKHTKNQEYEKD